MLRQCLDHKKTAVSLHYRGFSKFYVNFLRRQQQSTALITSATTNYEEKEWMNCLFSAYGNCKARVFVLSTKFVLKR